MLSQRIVCTSLIACTTIVSFAGPTSALALPGLRQQVYGEIEFITGGVGEREREALTNMENAYTLFVSMALETGAYVADVRVRLRNERGQTVLETTTRGPFLLADVPAGRYQVEATTASGERTERSTVDVMSGTLARTFLTFPPERR
jgi:hypothetical protein